VQNRCSWFTHRQPHQYWPHTGPKIAEMLHSISLKAFHNSNPISQPFCASPTRPNQHLLHVAHKQHSVPLLPALEATPQMAAAAASTVTSVGPSSPSTRNTSCKRRSWLLQPLRLDEVWYLGYGSNMSPQVLTGRRRVRPRQSIPCYVPGYHLSFGVQGFPWSEPGFATITPCHSSSGLPLPPGSNQPGSDRSSSSSSSGSAWRKHLCAGKIPCLHAVLHRITKEEWGLVKASEGVVLGSDSSGVGYQVCGDCGLELFLVVSCLTPKAILVRPLHSSDSSRVECGAGMSHTSYSFP
jgi:hypothetical protein